MKPVDVAVGVLIRPDGSFLIAQRPPGKPMAGYWEFPGGKVEPGESIFDALRREFKEELGITITKAHPWAQRLFVYPHATVNLHYWRVFVWVGAPRALEAQAFDWDYIDVVRTEPWLPGALPLKRWLQLPKVYAISNAAEMGISNFLKRLDQRLEAKTLQLLQLREKTIGGSAFAKLFAEVRARAREHRVRLLVNSDHPETYWSQADGVHCTSRMLMAALSKPDCEWCAASCHDAAEIARAGELDFDFTVLGPVKPTATHRGANELGWEGFSSNAASTRIPVYALGGLGLADLPQAISHGAQGIAAMRAGWS
jgi:8-oxo-dGTP diphosphatase